MRIENVTAYPISVRIPKEHQSTIGIGRMYKRDAVIIKVETKGGLVGFGESHHARNPGAIAHIVNTTMRNLLVGMDAAAVTDIWSKIYKAQFASHGMGAGSIIAMSGIDMALWDIRGKAVGWPLYKLLGGSARKIPAYAGGGGSLGFAEPAKTVDEVGPLLEMGFKAIKIRVGQSPVPDLARVSAVRKAYGDNVVILTDANAAYTIDDARRVMPAMESLNVGWLEEPFPAHDHRSYALAAGFSSTPLALGENVYTRFEFVRIIEDGVISILQPDVGKAGGVTEALRISALASAFKLPIHPHGGVTGLDLAAGIHLLASIDNGGYFESSEGYNPLRERPFNAKPYELDKDGCVRPLEAPGIGLDVDEKFLLAHPVIEGPGFV